MSIFSWLNHSLRSLHWCNSRVSCHVSWSGRYSRDLFGPLITNACISESSARCGTSIGVMEKPSWVNAVLLTISLTENTPWSNINLHWGVLLRSVCSDFEVCNFKPFALIVSLPNCPKPSTWPKCA